MKASEIHHTNVSLLVVLALFFLFVSCNSTGKQNEKSPDYQIMVVKPGSKTLETNYVSVIKGKQNVEIRPQINGTITEIRIEEGAAVRKGEILFIIDQAPYRAALKMATANVKSTEAKLATARMTVDSKEALRKEDIISDFDLQTARNALLEAQANLELAEAQLNNAATDLSYTEIKSPVNGVAGMIPYRVGALVDNNIPEPLITVSDDEDVYAYFSMTENQVLDIIQQQGSLEKLIQNAAEVKLRLGNGTLYTHAGKIDAVSGTIDPGTGTVSLRAVFPNPERWLRNGGTGQVVLTTSKTDCIVIPQSATYEIQNRRFAYKVIDGKAVSTPIEVENTNDGKEYIVTSGLQDGDTIISEGAGLVREGAFVSKSINQ